MCKPTSFLVMIIGLHSKWFGQKSDVVVNSSSNAKSLVCEIRMCSCDFIHLLAMKAGKREKENKELDELHLYLKYVGVVQFVFHVLQLLSIRFYTTKSVSNQQIYDEASTRIGSKFGYALDFLVMVIDRVCLLVTE